MKCYVTAKEIREYSLVIEGEDSETIEKYIMDHEDDIVALLKEKGPIIRDFSELYIEDIDETVENVLADFTI